MLPAYIDPIAPGLAEAWGGALAGELAWIAGAALFGTVAVVILVAAEAIAAGRRRGAPDRAPALRIHPLRRVAARP